MAYPPAYCPNCDKYFFSRAFSFGVVHGVTFSNVGISCPFSPDHSNAIIIDGTYDFIGDVVKVIQAPSVSLGRLKQLHSLLEAYANDRIGSAELIKGAEKEDPVFGQFLARLGQDPSVNAVYMLICIILAIIAIYHSLPDRADEAEDLILDEVIRNQPLPDDDNWASPVEI